MEFWQFGRLVDTKVGLNPPIHYIRSPLDQSGSCGAKQATFQQTRSEAECFNGIGWQPIKQIVAVIGWKGQVFDEYQFSGATPSWP